MRLPFHVIAVVAFSIAALACAVLLPGTVAGLSTWEGALIGALVLMGGAVVQESIVRHRATTRLSEGLERLETSHESVMRELTRAREEAGRIVQAIEIAMGEKRATRTLQADVDSVVAEVRVLQRLVDQIADEAEAPAALRAGAGGRPDLRVVTPPPGRGTAHTRASQTDAAETVEDDAAELAGDLSDEEIGALIRDALRRDRIELVLQPIVSLPQRKHRFYEAFTRIRTDDGRILLPEQYVALAEREGLITPIDNLLLFRSIQHLRNARKRSRNLGFFCNVSPYTLADRKFFTDFVDFMGDNAEIAPDLVFEFPQATVANLDDETGRMLRVLATLGVRYSMDQVTSPRIDYTELAERRFRFVKIDASVLLAEMERAGDDIDLTDLKRRIDRHGLDLIAEKIETEHQLRELLDLGIDYGQGYLFGEPQPSRTV